jgi:phosphate transport system protein
MLKTYEIKLKEIKKNIYDIGDNLIKSNELILYALDNCDISNLNKAKNYTKNVSKKTNNIDNSIIKTLALHAPEAKDLRTMISYLKVTNELLRASANTRNFIKGFFDVCDDIDINKIKIYALPMQKSTIEALKTSISMLDIDCIDEIQETFNKVLVSQNKAEDLYDLVENLLLKDAQNSKNFNKYHSILIALRKSEKIADRAISIASLLLYANNGGEIHQAL